jgi:23S rRNA pseudouridine955/2504/2580 synthase
MTEVRQFTVAADDEGIRIDRWFKRHLPTVSFNTVSRWARTGQLRVDGKRATPGDRLTPGQVLRVPPEEAAAPATMSVVKPRRELSPDQVEFARSLVIHIDDDAIVIAKPPGLATQGGTGTTEHVDGLLDALQHDLPGRPKLVHRLDRDTSGVLLLARTARAAAFFSKEFAGRDAKKVYWALAMGVPSPEHGMIDAPLAKQPGTGGEKMHVDDKEGLPARTRYRTVDRAGNSAVWLEMQPLTGRTHQLRVHAAAIGHPLVGDAKYGGRDAFLTGNVSRKMHLHARRLVIAHPGGGTLDITAPLPSHMAESFQTLGFDPVDGDTLPLETVKFRDTPEGQKKLAAAEAKSRRKERKGERRARGR